MKVVEGRKKKYKEYFLRRKCKRTDKLCNYLEIITAHNGLV